VPTHRRLPIARRASTPMTDRPGQVPREYVLNNQRPSLKERSKKHVSSQERREGNSKAHLELVRQLPSCVSGVAGPCDPHHLRSGPAAAERGVQMKATDRWVVPITRFEHDELHRLSSRIEEAWFRERGVADVVELANALWVNTGDLDRMLRVLQAHVGRPRRGR
jgi:hypothetical protein